MTPFPLPSGLVGIKALPRSLAASLVWTLGCCCWVDFTEAISFTGAFIQTQETPESPSGFLSERHRSIFMAFRALKCSWSTLLHTSLETAFREALLTGQVNSYSYKNILLVKQREQQPLIQSMSLALRDVTLPCSHSPAQFQGRIIFQQPS